MKKVILLYLCLLSYLPGFGQVPLNDECTGAIEILDARDFCSVTAQYNNINATPSFSGTGQDVWFKFTARNFEVKITVSGAPAGGSLQAPIIRLYNDCTGGPRVAPSIQDGNTTIFNDAGLIPGKVYFISVSGTNNNTGTFKLCIENYQSEIKPGQDAQSASLLCTTQNIIREVNVTGSGNSGNETSNTCIGNEKHSAWYKWTAANSGTLVFTITPTKRDDIDWVLFELGPEGNTQAPSTANAIRCAAGHGIDNSGCPNEPMYTQTGLDFNETDLVELGGCGLGQNGVLKFVDMKEGYVYTLIVNNFTEGNNGFEIAFTDKAGKAGSGLFKGPTAKLSTVVNNECSPAPSYTFSSIASDYTSIKWYFGEGANIDSADTLGPFEIKYSTSGLKTVVLLVKNDLGCSVVQTETFMVTFKPDPPKITGYNSRYCIGETISLNTPVQGNATYSWTGPNGFTSDKPEISIPVDNANKAGTYALRITINGCSSDPASVTVQAIGQTPTAAFIKTSTDPCTAKQTFTFTNNSSDYLKLRWNFGEGASIPPGSSNPVYTVSYSSSGTKTIILEAEGSSGCISIFKDEIIVALSPELPLINANKPDFCLTDTIRLSTPAQTDVIYNWTGPNNFTSDQREPQIPVNSAAVAGTYSLVVRRGNCSTKTVSIVVPPIYKNPEAAFRSEPKIPSKLSAPIRVRFFNESKDADVWLWDFGDNTTSTDKDPEHTYLIAGDYDVSLTAFKSSVCSASVVHGKLMISPDNILFIPNTFTPNNDASNDEFVVSMTNIKTYRIRIFNRYGTPLFTSDDLFNNWKGTYKNEPLPVGTYYYIIDATDFNDTVIKRSGSVTLLR